MPRTRILVVDRDAPDPAALAEAAAVLRAGGLVAFATETVYGLGADATSAKAVQGIFTAKGRPSDNPLIVHAADVAMARRHAAAWPAAAARLAELWPGPLTLVMPKAASIPAITSAGLLTVGLRVPVPAVARGLIAAAGVPLAAPSANRSEHVSPTRAEHVLADLDGRIDLVLDSGPTDVGIESTVVDVTGDVPRVLRPGPLDAERLAAHLGTPVEQGPASGPARSPGQRERHYAPRTPALRVSSLAELVRLAPGAKDVVLVLGELGVGQAGRVEADLVQLGLVHAGIAEAGLEHAGLEHADLVQSGLAEANLGQAGLAPTIELPSPEIAARSLYATLRACDARGVRRILVVMPPDVPAWQAVRDRLLRATMPAAG